MRHLYLAVDNVLDGAPIHLRSEQIAALPRAHLQSKRLERMWRVTASDVAEFNLSGIAKPIQFAALLNHNLSPGNTTAKIAKYSSYNTSTQSGPVDVAATIDTPLMPQGMQRHFFSLWPNETDTGDYLVVDLAEPGLGFMQAGRAWAGPLLTLPPAKMSVRFEDTGTINRSKRGYAYPVPGARYRILGLTIALADFEDVWGGSDPTVETLVSAVTKIQQGQEVIAFPYVDDPSAIAHAGFYLHRTAVYGTLRADPAIDTVAGRFESIRLEIEELR